MQVQDYLTISKYFDCCWTGNKDELRNLFDSGAKHLHIHSKVVDEENDVWEEIDDNHDNCVREVNDVDNIMSEYEFFFQTTDLKSTIVRQLEFYPGENDHEIVTYYYLTQEKQSVKYEFRIRQTFVLTPEFKIQTLKMEVEKQ